VRRERLDDGVLISKAIDNSQVVRERDPRSSRDLWWLLTLVMAFSGGLVIYAWPHYELRQIAIAKQQMQRERERLIEENRKLLLEKAALEDLQRVEAIAVRDLGLITPPADHLIVVEMSEGLADEAQLAGGIDAGPGRAGPDPRLPAGAAPRPRDPVAPAPKGGATPGGRS
jgi:cell division protein FtsL